MGRNVGKKSAVQKRIGPDIFLQYSILASVSIRSHWDVEVSK